MASKKALSTQHLANAYPAWSNTRIDEQSAGQQYLNVIGNRIEDLRKQNARIRDNFFLPTSYNADIDVYYQLRLPGSFTFVKEDNDDTELIFTPPEVSGVQAGTTYSVQIADENDIETFWYTAAPDRLSLEVANSGEILIASGFAHLQPLDYITNSGIIDPPNRLHVTMSGGGQYIRIDDNNITHRTIVQIEGITRAGAHVVEELPFLHDETLPTFHEFRELAVSGVRVYGPSLLDQAHVSVTNAQFNAVDYDHAYDLAVTDNKDEMPLYWAIGSGYSPHQRVLDLKKYDIDDVVLRSEGFVTKQTILQQELANVSGVAIVPQDLAVEPRSDNLWVVDSGTLYMFSSDLPYPDHKPLLGKDYDAHSVIDPSSYYVVLNQEVQLDYIWRRPVQGMVRHRVSVLKPNGVRNSIESGAEVTYHTDESSWVFGEPVGRQIRPSDIFTLDQRGSYVYTLEVQYADGTRSIDRRIITVAYQQAKAQFDLNNLGIPNTIVGVDFDSEHKLWVLDTAGGKYQINRHYDRMLIDFGRKIIYLRENYDQVRVF